LIKPHYRRRNKMQKPRERMFFGVSDMNAWKFTGINILNTLWLLHDRKRVHGRALQQILWDLFDETWAPGNDLIYPILNIYESEGYITSYWEKDDDPDKKYVRKYTITDSGVEYLNTLKLSFVDTLKHMQKVFNLSLYFNWGDTLPQNTTESSELISSSNFTALNLLTFLRKQKNNGIPWMYAKEIQNRLSLEFSGLWKPSDGVLYPMLSQFSTKGYLKSRWVEGKKKRTIREYVITNKGEEYLTELLSSISGLKNKIIQLEGLCSKSCEYISGSKNFINQIVDILKKQAG